MAFVELLSYIYVWWYYLGKLHQYITRISLYWCQTFLDGVTSTYWRWVRVLRLSASVALWLWTFLLLVDLSGRVPFKSTFHLSFSICTCDASGVDDSHYWFFWNTGYWGTSSWVATTLSLMLVNWELGSQRQHKQSTLGFDTFICMLSVWPYLNLKKLNGELCCL